MGDGENSAFTGLESLSPTTQGAEDGTKCGPRLVLGSCAPKALLPLRAILVWILSSVPPAPVPAFLCPVPVPRHRARLEDGCAFSRAEQPSPAASISSPGRLEDRLMDGLVGVDSFPESAWKRRRNASTTCPKNTIPSWDCRSHPSARSHPAPQSQQHPSDGASAWGNSSETVPKKKKTSPSSVPGLILNVCVWQAPAG